jgi:hypothetical protein
VTSHRLQAERIQDGRLQHRLYAADGSLMA